MLGSISGNKNLDFIQRFSLTFELVPDFGGGCLDQAGNPITVDQISTPRPLDGNTDEVYICDIGALEYDQDHTTQWKLLKLIQR